jgi:putative transposase
MMAQSLAQLYIHMVFSTKRRRPFLRNRELRGKTHAYLVGILNNHDSPSLIVGGDIDHVHIVCSFSRKLAVSDLIRDMKRDSSKWIKTQASAHAKFGWQDGFGAFSVSPGHLPSLKHYVANQEEHHRTETFQEEFRRLLKKYRIPYDERYVWD